MIKAIFFDVDGTLISKSRSVLSEGVIAALKKLQEKGIKLFIYCKWTSLFRIR